MSYARRGQIFWSTLAAIAVSLLPLVIYTGYSLIKEASKAEIDARDDVGAYSTRSAIRLREALRRATGLLSRLSEIPEMRDPGQDRCSRYLHSVVAGSQLISEIGVIGIGGNPICSTENLLVKNQNYANDKWFEEITVNDANGPKSTTVVFGVAGRVNHYTAISAPMTIGGGEPSAFVVAFLEVERLGQTLAVGKADFVADQIVLDSQRRIVARYPSDSVWTDDEIKEIPLAEELAASPDQNRIRRYQTAAGLDLMGSEEAVGMYGLVVASRATTATVFFDSSNQARNGLLAALGALALSIWAAWMVSRRVSGPVLNLLGAMREIRAGNSVARASEALSGEFGELGVDLNRLIDSQQATDAQLGESRLHAQRMQDFYKALSSSNQAIARAVDLESLYTRICEICANQGKVSMAWVGEVSGHSMRPIAWSESAKAYVANREIQWRLANSPNVAPIARAIETGEPWICNDYPAYIAASGRPAQHETENVGAAIIVPICAVGSATRFLAIYLDKPEIFDAPLIELFEELAKDMVFASQKMDAEKASSQTLLEMELGYGRFRKIFDMMPVPAVIVRVNDPIMLDANEAFGRQMGIQAERLPGRRARDLGIGPTPDAVTALIKEVSEIGAVRNRGMTMRTVSGEERQVICNLEPFEFMGEGAILAISTDITDTLEMGDKLGLREQQLISIVDTAIDTIITLNSEMRVVVFNQAACQMFGVTEAQMLGESLDRVRIDELRELQGRKFMDFLESTDVSTEAFECIGRHSNGAEVPMEVTLSKAGKGANTLVTVVSRDISHQQIIAQARTAAASIEFAGKAKSTLLSQVSHELRTPLGAIIGFAQLINDETDEPIPQSQRARLNMLMKAAAHLHLMLGDIQDFSLIEARGVRLQPVVVDLRSAVDSALCISQPAASERGIRLVASDGNGQRATVLADQLRLGQVLLNLISNGIKYNRNGGSVTVSIGAEPRLVHIDVEDDGLGMTEAQVGNLFQPFNRLGREGGSIEGSGIGLVLTRRLVNLMGGEVTVRSVAGEGSCFRVTLPALSITETPDLTGSDATEPTPIPTEFVETKTRPAFRFDQGESPVGTVLCMEDNEVTSILITQLVSRWPGVTLVMAADGTTGIEKAIALQPDVVLLDMNLPDMSGLEVLARLRGNVETRDLVVVALTASSNPDEIEAAEAVGIDGYWSKPIDFQQFFDGLRRLLAKAAAADRPH